MSVTTNPRVPAAERIAVRCVDSDVHPMPRRGELIEYIRTQSWQAEVPILMVTSEQNMGRLAAVERAGVSAICDKPFEAGSIRRLISEALTR